MRIEERVGGVGVERRPRLPNGLVDRREIALDDHDGARVERRRAARSAPFRDRPPPGRTAHRRNWRVRPCPTAAGAVRPGPGLDPPAQRRPLSCGPAARYATPAETAINREAARASCGSVKTNCRRRTECAVPAHGTTDVVATRAGSRAAIRARMPGQRSAAGIAVGIRLRGGRHHAQLGEHRRGTSRTQRDAPRTRRARQPPARRRDIPIAVQSSACSSILR